MIFIFIIIFVTKQYWNTHRPIKRPAANLQATRIVDITFFLQRSIPGSITTMAGKLRSIISMEKKCRTLRAASIFYASLTATQTLSQSDSSPEIRSLPAGWLTQSSFCASLAWDRPAGGQGWLTQHPSREGVQGAPTEEHSHKPLLSSRNGVSVEMKIQEFDQ